MHDTARLRTIARLSRRLRWVVWFFLAIIAFVSLAAALVPSTAGTVSFGDGSDEFPLAEVEPSYRFLVLALLAPTIITWMGILWSCDNLLALYEYGSVLERSNGTAIRRIGQWILALAVVDFGQPFVAALFFEGVHLQFSTTTLAQISIAVGVMVVGQVMYLAAEMAEEAELTV